MRGHHELANAIRQQARAAMDSVALPGIYEISSYDGKGNIKVNISFDKNSNPVESNWMPLGCIGVGNGWGVSVGPQIGDQVMVEFENGDFEGGVVVARIHSTQQQAMPVPSGEIWAVHQTGTSLKFTTNGDCVVYVAGNMNATVIGNMSSTVTGNASVTAANSSVTATSSATVTAPVINIGALGQTLRSFVTDLFMSLFNGHTHTSSTSGTPTSTPNQTMNSSHLTSTVKGG